MNVAVDDATGPLGPLVMVTVGPAASITHSYVASGPTLPMASVARMRKKRMPAGSAAVVDGDTHGAYGMRPSIWHSNVDGSLAVNSKVGVVSPDGLSGRIVMLVIGPVESI